MSNIDNKKCVLYDRDCIDCGECDVCDLDPNKICDNCGKCAEVCHPQALYICGKDYTVEELVARLLQDRKFFKMGGGVTIDLIHELDYMVDLFGFPQESYNFKGTYSDLEIDSDDLSVYIARYKDKLCEVHLDYFGREYRRTCEVFVSEGTYL